jgi:hypothetical protein
MIPPAVLCECQLKINKCEFHLPKVQSTVPELSNISKNVTGLFRAIVLFYYTSGRHRTEKCVIFASPTWHLKSNEQNSLLNFTAHLWHKQNSRLNNDSQKLIKKKMLRISTSKTENMRKLFLGFAFVKIPIKSYRWDHYGINLLNFRASITMRSWAHNDKYKATDSSDSISVWCCLPNTTVIIMQI